MQVPGFLWVAILALIPLVIQWLQGDYFSGQTWVSFAVIVLGFFAKLIEVYRAEKTTPTVRGLERATPTASKAVRFWLG